MVTGNGNQGVNGGGNGNDPIWAIPSVGNNGLYRGAMPSNGIHFMNFASPMNLMPGSQLGSGIVGGGGGGGGSGIMAESNLSMLSAMNAYRQIHTNGMSESPGQHHGGGDDGHDSSSQQS
ncbi:transcription factor TCP14-like [Trifolium medium]|uniref:Transcription factor TCP14-like n=1 Tax=Trifolium medium TaxID=97028 RepID=A0A392QI76_9FABA|nr:transcription factor TCP14-like [Trifolium medium]